MKIQFCHKYGYQTHIDSVIIADSITVLINDEVVKNEDGSIRTFSSVPNVYKYLLEKAGIDIDEVHTVG